MQSRRHERIFREGFTGRAPRAMWSRDRWTRSRRAVLAVLLVIFAKAESVLNKEKVIDETPMNIVVVAGSTALLPCSVDPRYTEQYADHYKLSYDPACRWGVLGVVITKGGAVNQSEVMWVNPMETVISLQDRRILNDARISVERPFLKDWNLHIRNVSLTDAGVYKCQINTVPVGTKKINLSVQEPPRIIGHTTPTDVDKPEGERVELSCNATGTPQPAITWYRINKLQSGIREKVGHTGEFLVIHNISRSCAGNYECVADNGVAPAISHMFKVTVLYPPEVTLQNIRLNQQVGKDTILDCTVSASPLGIAQWKHNGKILSNNPEYELNLYNMPDDSIVLSLRILHIKPSDFGIYVCEATNPLGVRTATMELFELSTTTHPPSTTSSTTSFYRHSPEHDHRHHNYQEGGHSLSGSPKKTHSELINDKNRATKPFDSSGVPQGDLNPNTGGTDARSASRVGQRNSSIEGVRRSRGLTALTFLATILYLRRLVRPIDS